MKQMILAMVLLFSTLSAAAQNVKNDSIQEKFFNAKVRELVYRLHITDEQKAKFVPVYRRYNDEMRAAWGVRAKKGNAKTDKEKNKQRTSADVAAAKKKQIERQQKVQNVQMKYLDEFAKVLNAQQLNRFFDVEKKIQSKAMQRKIHKRGKMGIRPNKGHKHPQGQKRPYGKGHKNGSFEEN